MSVKVGVLGTSLIAHDFVLCLRNINLLFPNHNHTNIGDNIGDNSNINSDMCGGNGGWEIVITAIASNDLTRGQQLADKYHNYYPNPHPPHYYDRNHSSNTLKDPQLIDSELIQQKQSEEERQSYYQHVSGIKIYSSYEAMMHDTSIDVVYIASCNIDHYHHARLALSFKKGVLLEKTFVMNAEQCEELMRLAGHDIGDSNVGIDSSASSNATDGIDDNHSDVKAVVDERCDAGAAIEEHKDNVMTSIPKPLFLVEANWMMHWPLIRQTMAFIRSNEIGKIQLVQADLGFCCPHRKIVNPRFGGGSLLAVGMYGVALSQAVFGGPPTTIHSHAILAEDTAYSSDSEGSAKRYQADDTCSVICGYSGGGQAVITGSVVINTASLALITGTLGTMRLSGPMFVCPTKLEIDYFDGRPSVAVMNPSSPKLNQQPEDFTYNFPNSWGLAYQVEHLRECLQRELHTSDIWGTSDTLDLMRTLDTIRRQCGIVYDV